MLKLSKENDIDLFEISILPIATDILVGTEGESHFHLSCERRYRGM